MVLTIYVGERPTAQAPPLDTSEADPARPLMAMRATINYRMAARRGPRIVWPRAEAHDERQIVRRNSLIQDKLAFKLS